MAPVLKLVLLALLLPNVGCGGGSPSDSSSNSSGSGAPSPSPSPGATPRFPSYNTDPIAPDMTGMSSTATQLAGHIKLGWNCGNTLEATGGETAWGNPVITDELIQLVKRNGFQAIRLPASWDQYADHSTAKIAASWLDRVKQVVQYCVSNDLYVIVNIHWDGGWLEENVTPEKQEEVNARQKAYWEQIATHLRAFDEHLLFASANEPNVRTSAQMEVLLSYHQTFINAVRSTGGRNAYRTLVVQGPNTDIETTSSLMTRMPTDAVPNRLMAEVHYYTPWNFTGLTQDQSWGNQFYYWGKGFHSTTDTAHNATWGEEGTVDQLLSVMRQQFVDKGIPVVIGEFGAMRRDNLAGDALQLHLASRAYYLKYVTKRANANGLLPFYWDAGGLHNLGSGIFDRASNTVFDQQSLDALIQGATE
jgi:endoglucanase